MALYMTQSMSSLKTERITYYRKQKQEHVSHVESGTFTQDAITNYAQFNHLSREQVVVGSDYKSKQGVPTGGKVYEI
jgi:hypothetical protein